MKNEVSFSPSFSGGNPPAKMAARQAPRNVARTNSWRLPPTPEYLQALREAEEVVYRYMLERN